MTNPQWLVHLTQLLIMLKIVVCSYISQKVSRNIPLTPRNGEIQLLTMAKVSLRCI